MALDIFNTLSSFSNNVINLIYFGKKLIDSNSFDISKIPLIIHSSSQLWSFFLQNKIAKLQTLTSNQALQRIKDLFEIINQEKTIAKTITHDDPSIILKDYSLKLLDKDLINLETLKLSPGIYLLSGKSGCGKTSLINDLVSGVSGDLKSYGEIYLPKDHKIISIGKEIYKIPDLTLFEIVCYPLDLNSLSDLERNNLKEIVISLLEKLEIDQFVNDPFATQGIIFNLDTEELSLSSGQNQKISIIQAILQNISSPKDIVFMDEPWSNLDSRSEQLCKALIKECFANKIVIIVDHGESKQLSLGDTYKAEIHIEEDCSASYQENLSFSGENTSSSY